MRGGVGRAPLLLPTYYIPGVSIARVDARAEKKSHGAPTGQGWRLRFMSIRGSVGL